jgi:hypothetical protein
MTAQRSQARNGVRNTSPPQQALLEQRDSFLLSSVAVCWSSKGSSKGLSKGLSSRCPGATELLDGYLTRRVARSQPRIAISFYINQLMGVAFLDDYLIRRARTR